MKHVSKPRYMSAKWSSLFKIHNLYIILSSITCLLFILITPPFHGPDEDVHFFRAYQIARGSIVMEKHGNDVGTCLPKEIVNTVIDTSLTPNIRGLTTQKYQASQIKADIFNPINHPKDCVFTPTTNTRTYNPLVYTPAVVGIELVNVFNGPPLLALYLARFFTMLVTIFICAIALRILPNKKYVFMVILLTPMILYQQSLVSSDGLSYAMLALFVAYVIRLYNKSNTDNKIISRKNWIYLGLISIALCCMKPLLFVFVPVVFILLPINIWKPIIITVASIVFVGMNSLWTNSIYKGVENTGAPGSDPAVQIRELEKNPPRAARIAWNTYMNSYGDGQTEGVIGLFGYADTKIPLWVYTVSVINLALSVMFTSKKYLNKRMSRWGTIIIIVLGVIYFIGVNAAMYIEYSPVGGNIFYGVQGRYFLPLLITLPLIATGGFILRDKDYERLRKYITISTTAVIVLCLIVVFQRYYLYTP